jgi:hypothetical protein
MGSFGMEERKAKAKTIATANTVVHFPSTTLRVRMTRVGVGCGSARTSNRRFPSGMTERKARTTTDSCGTTTQKREWQLKRNRLIGHK